MVHTLVAFYEGFGYFGVFFKNWVRSRPEIKKVLINVGICLGNIWISKQIVKVIMVLHCFSAILEYEIGFVSQFRITWIRSYVNWTMLMSPFLMPAYMYASGI